MLSLQEPQRRNSELPPPLSNPPRILLESSSNPLLTTLLQEDVEAPNTQSLLSPLLLRLLLVACYHARHLRSEPLLVPWSLHLFQR